MNKGYIGMGEKTSDLKLTIYLRDKIAQLFSGRIIDFLLLFYQPYKRHRMPEKMKTYGELFPDRTFYVIRLYPPATGYLGNYNYILGYMRYAYQKGWIPIVDMYHYDTIYSLHNIEQDYPKDVWGMFFEQPWDPVHKRRYTLDEVYQSKNVVLSCGSEEFCVYSFEEETISWQRRMAKMIPFNKEMQEYADNMLQETIGQINLPVMGIPFRGTDYKKKYAGHKIQLDPIDVEKYYSLYKRRWYGESDIYVFCNTEEQQVLDFVLKSIPNVIASNTYRFKRYSGISMGEAINKEDKFSMLKDYLANMYVLSKCDSMIGTLNNGLYVAFLWSEGNYSHFECIDLGKYK